jgi:hypothetical protein
MKTTMPLGDKVIAFYPVFASSFGSVVNAIYIQQLRYWSDKGKRADGFIYKTKQELKEETTLSIKQQDKCRKYFENNKILITKKIKAKGSPTIHYKINFSMLRKVILEYDKKSHSNMTKSNKPITENTTESTNILSKDNREADASTIQHPLSEKIIKDWNKDDYTKKVDTKKRTNVIKRIESIIKQLKAGTFINKNREFDSKWKTNLKIPSKMDKLTSKQIQHVINRMKLYLKEGYFPENKSNVGRLCDMLYNPRTQKSWFLMALYNPPKPIHIELKDDFPDVTEYLASHMNGTFNKKRDKNKLIERVREIKEFCDAIPESTLSKPDLGAQVDTPMRICKQFIYWIGYQDWLKELSLSAFNVKGGVWRKFVKFKEEEFDGYKLQ